MADKMDDRQFTHPHFGKEVRVELCGRKVRLIFTANTELQADGFAEELVRQLKTGALNLTLMGTPTSIAEELS